MLGYYFSFLDIFPLATFTYGHVHSQKKPSKLGRLVLILFGEHFFIVFSQPSAARAPLVARRISKLQQRGGFQPDERAER